MKKILFIISIFQSIILHAQNVGIGTNNPDASALLHLNSTTKGILIPSMTGSQRIALSNPAEGLLIYDLTQKKTFQYQDGVWRFLITNEYWAHSGTRNWVYNGSDSVGIGTAAPLERLHINNGNLRISGNLKLLGNAGIGTLDPEQALHVRTTIPSEGIVLDGENPILQLRQSNVSGSGFTEKGFVQLSGDNLRIGTNSSNANGKMIVRTGGADRVSIDENGIELQNNAKITKPATGTAGLLPVAYGRTASITTGGIEVGTSNVTVTRVKLGTYKIECADFTSNTIILVTPIASGVTIAAINNNGEFTVITRSITSGNDLDQIFNFVAY